MAFELGYILIGVFAWIFLKIVDYRQRNK